MPAATVNRSLSKVSLFIFSLLIFAFSFALVSCDLLNPLPEEKLEKKIDEKTAYAKAPWVPLRIETGDLGITTPPSQSHDKLVKLGYSFKLVFIPNSGYPFRGWQAWVEGEGIHSLWRNNAVDQDAAYHPERVKFVPLNSSGTEVEIFVYEMPPKDKRFIIGPWGATNDELTVLPDSGGLGSIYPARLSGVKRDFPFTMNFQPSSAYPFRGWQAKFLSGGVLLGESVWAVAENGSGEQRVNGVLWSPRNVSGLEMDVTVEETPEGFLPAEGSIIIGPLGMDSDLLNVRVNGGGLGTAGSTLTVAAPARKGYPFTLSFQPSQAYPFRGWQALFFSDDGSLLAGSVWAAENGSGEQRVNGVLWSPQNMSGLEMRVTIEAAPDGFLPAGTIVIGPLGMDSENAPLSILASAAWGITNPPPGELSDKKLGFPFTVEFAVASGWAFVEWRAYSYDGTVEEWSRGNPGVLLDPGDVKISDQGGGKAEVTIYTGKRVTLIPYCIKRVEVTTTNLPGYFDDRKVTNYPIKIWFSHEIADECITPENFTLTAVTNLGFGEERAINNCYILPTTRAKGNLVTIVRNLDENIQDFINLNITLKLNLGSIYDKTDKVPMGESGQYREFYYGISYRVYSQPPLTENLEAATAAGEMFAGNNTTNIRQKHYYVTEENGERAVYLLFDKASLDGSIDQTVTNLSYLGITEKGDEGSSFSEYGYGGNGFTDNTGRLFGGERFDTLRGKYKEAHSGREPYVVRHVLETKKNGVIELAVQPTDDLENRDPFDSAQKVRVILDTIPPGRVTITKADYDYNAKTLNLEWTNPDDDDFDKVLLSWGIAGETPGKVDLPLSDSTSHVFSGITPPNRYTFSFSTVDVAGNTNVHPVTAHAVTFNSNGGTPTFDPQYVLAGRTTTKPADPTRNGYDFDGWYTNDNFSTKWNFENNVTANMTLHAKWLATVKFESNGGTTVSDQYILPDGKVQPVNSTRSGYALEGWYRDNDTFNNKWNFNDDTVTGHMTLYAKWTRNKYTVTFNANSGTPAPATQNVDHGGKVAQPANPTRTGYTFAGWFKEEALTNQWNFNDDTVTGNMTLFAKWTLNNYTVTFNANSGTPAPEPKNVDHGGNVTQPANPSRDGYAFAGWFKEAALTNQWNFNTDTVTGNMTLFARWTYTVTFDIGSETIGTAPVAITANAGSSITLPGAGNLARTGKTFSGWNTNTDGTGTNYNAGSSQTLTNTALYPRWDNGGYVRSDNRYTVNTLQQKLDWLQTNAQSNASYIVEVTSVASNNIIAPHTLSYDNNRTNITVTLTGVDANSIVDLSSNGSMFTVSSGIKLILDNNITLRGRSSNTAALVTVNSGGTLKMEAGSVIKDNKNTSTSTSTSGGGVSVWNGTFTMNGGTISNNETSRYGGGVFMTNNGTFTMSGTAKISGNKASGNGGGVDMSGSSSIFTMNGGEISGNTATTGSGGGVLITDGTFAMSGGTISGNTSTNGGGVFVNTNGTLEMTGGTISVNTATAVGGGVCVLGGTFIMYNGEISDNNAAAGGGVSLSNIFTMSGGTISSNTATNGGGVNIVGNGTFTMNGGTISDNTATNGNGGGIDLGSGTFTMNSGTISGNKASNGGGVSLAGTFTMNGGTISGNIAATEGGGVNIWSGTFTKTGGTITGYGNDKTVNGNLVGVRNSSGTVTTEVTGKGHAVYAIKGSTVKRKENTHTGTEELSFNRTVNPPFSGGWDY